MADLTVHRGVGHPSCEAKWRRRRCGVCSFSFLGRGSCDSSVCEGLSGKVVLGTYWDILPLSAPPY